jgi:molybdopterin molybdotransferase
MLSRLQPVASESLPLELAVGRVLAQAVVADRDNPPCDISAMDGYAVRIDDLRRGWLPVTGEASIGRSPSLLPEGSAMRIFTGGPVPPGTEAVVRREDTQESPHRIIVCISSESVRPGQDIRRRGENVTADQVVVAPGCRITAATVSAMASFGVHHPKVHQRLRVAIIVTGDEICRTDEQPDPWRIRDANGPALAALLDSCPWITRLPIRRVHDDFDTLHSTLAAVLRSCDAVLVTGGVSMGDHDHVPDVVRAVGGQVIFHKLPIRPGKPVLGAIGPQGQAIFGLPGNPVSALVTARRLALPVLAVNAGFTHPDIANRQVQLINNDHPALNMYWYRLARCLGNDVVELVTNHGSGDLVAVARSDGFVEVPPGGCSAGGLPFYAWGIA